MVTRWDDLAQSVTAHTRGGWSRRVAGRRADGRAGTHHDGHLALDPHGIERVADVGAALRHVDDVLGRRTGLLDLEDREADLARRATDVRDVVRDPADAPRGGDPRVVERDTDADVIARPVRTADGLQKLAAGRAAAEHRADRVSVQVPGADPGRAELRAQVAGGRRRNRHAHAVLAVRARVAHVAAAAAVRVGGQRRLAAVRRVGVAVSVARVAHEPAVAGRIPADRGRVRPVRAARDRARRQAGVGRRRAGVGGARVGLRLSGVDHGHARVDRRLHARVRRRDRAGVGHQRARVGRRLRLTRVGRRLLEPRTDLGPAGTAQEAGGNGRRKLLHDDLLRVACAHSAAQTGLFRGCLEPLPTFIPTQSGKVRGRFISAHHVSMMDSYEPVVRRAKVVRRVHHQVLHVSPPGELAVGIESDAHLFDPTERRRAAPGQKLKPMSSSPPSAAPNGSRTDMLRCTAWAMSSVTTGWNRNRGRAGLGESPSGIRRRRPARRPRNQEVPPLTSPRPALPNRQAPPPPTPTSPCTSPRPKIASTEAFAAKSGVNPGTSDWNANGANMPAKRTPTDDECG